MKNENNQNNEFEKVTTKRLKQNVLTKLFIILYFVRIK